MAKVKAFGWNPRRGGSSVVGRIRPRLGIGNRVNNFGDTMGPFIVREICQRWGLRYEQGPARARLLSIGSVMHLARRGDVIWGTGVNVKRPARSYGGLNLDVRAVRGPLTRDFLSARGVHVPEVYGDPALLLGTLYTRRELSAGYPPTEYLVVPNMNDLVQHDLASPNVMDVTDPLMQCVGRIAASEFVAGSSLHAIIVAEALGVPARVITSANEPLFKYQDYYLGSGRSSCNPVASVAEALSAGGEPGINWDPTELLLAFPTDIFDIEYLRGQGVMPGRKG